MSDDGNKPNGKEAKIPASEFHVIFQGPGSAHFKTQSIGVVTVEQLGALRNWLEWFVDRQRDFQADITEAALEQKLKNQVQVPDLIIPRNLKLKND